MVTVRAVGIGLLGKTDLPNRANTEPSAEALDKAKSADKQQRYRKLYLDNTWHNVPCIPRDDLALGGAPLCGPLVIEESYTVLLLHADWTVRVIDNGDLLCERSAGESV